jgi:hypothetical protein
MKTPAGRLIEIDPSDVKTRIGWGYTLVPDPDHDDGYFEDPAESKSAHDFGVVDYNGDLDKDIEKNKAKKKAKKKKAKGGNR